MITPSDIGGGSVKAACAAAAVLIANAKIDHHPFFRVNADGQLLYANDSACMLLRALGWRRQLLPEPFVGAMNRVRADREKLRMEVLCGEDIYSFLVAPGYAGYYYTFSGTRVDQTAALRQSLQETQAFAHSVAHDLRAPLRAIRMLAEEALTDGEPVLGSNAEALKRVTAVATRMHKFLDDLLEFSKSSLRDLDFQTIDVAALLRDLIQEPPQWQPPLAELQILAPSMPVRGDLASLTQCACNLLSNAIKFVPVGMRPRVLIFGRQNGPLTRIIFEDNGIGIAKKDLRAIFTPLHRSRNSALFEGTGLGLAIVHKAVTRMGGRIGVESELGKGSRFWLELPTAEAKVPNGEHVIADRNRAG